MPQPKKQRETMSVSFAIHDADLEANSFRGMASVFNNLIDAWIPSRILPGAFSKTLTENAQRIKVLYQHNPDWPIGLPTKMEENGDGLLVEATISQTTMGKDTLILLRDKVLTELSIGFDPIKYQMVDEGAGLGQVRHISEVRLWEFSPVTFAANSQARVSSVNSLFSAMRGMSIDLSEEAQALLQALVTYACANPTAEPSDLLGAVTRSFSEQHAGKVLSAKNLALVNNAIEALQALKTAAEPDEEESTSPLTDIHAQLRHLDNLHLDVMSRQL